MGGSGKIGPRHLKRKAVVYLRQSSMAQVRANTESTARQYGLADVAVEMGWPRGQVVVIDKDLGVSGKWGSQRAGFAELNALVCAGEVGAVFGLEISRLGRSNADVARLLQFAVITETVFVDADGVYDPTDPNDRMVLGFKATMGEMELHVMAGRMRDAKRAAAARGELRAQLPAGYVYAPDRAVVFDPDAEVQAAVRDLFAAFAQAGSAHGALKAWGGRLFPRRERGGALDGEVHWGPLTCSRALSVLKNPCYAGAYAAGRQDTAKSVEVDGTLHETVHARPRAEWEVLIQDHHPGYITWEEYLANEARLATNNSSGGARPPKDGLALCQGIISCGSCGRPMATDASRGSGAGSYRCISHTDNQNTKTCRSVLADIVDGAVAARLLDAVGADGIALAYAAAQEVEDRRAASDRRLVLAVDRAQYEADLAARAFRQVEPENRLVARNLEDRWEARLKALAEAENELEDARGAEIALPPREEIERIAGDLPALWESPQTTAKDRKRMLRALVADVTILPQENRSVVRIGIRWQTGASEVVEAARPPGGRTRMPPAALDLVKQEAPRASNRQIADQLNARGLTTGLGNPFDPHIVAALRDRHRLPACDPETAGQLSVPQAAQRLRCAPAVVRYWINTGKLAAQRSTTGQIAVPWDPSVEARCQGLIAASTRLSRQAPARR
ncbi:MAG: recombinase family protein [Bifidobacteriaceae bacterium]|jgi:DNA invertase Pin-like site-specific DNA recombinase|nr:recombinase family protein [Bifidobacteriaceae bacterium]